MELKPSRPRSTTLILVTLNKNCYFSKITLLQFFNTVLTHDLLLAVKHEQLDYWLLDVNVRETHSSSKESRRIKGSQTSAIDLH
jgi:hypothetical protein